MLAPGDGFAAPDEIDQENTHRSPPRPSHHVAVPGHGLRSPLTPKNKQVLPHPREAKPAARLYAASILPRDGLLARARGPCTLLRSGPDTLCALPIFLSGW